MLSLVCQAPLVQRLWMVFAVAAEAGAAFVVAPIAAAAAVPSVAD